MIPEHAIGKVIGKGGARIDALAKIHRCELKIRRDLALRDGAVPLEIQSINGSCSDVLGVERDVSLIVSEVKLSYFYKERIHLIVCSIANLNVSYLGQGSGGM